MTDRHTDNGIVTFTMQVRVADVERFQRSAAALLGCATSNTVEQLVDCSREELMFSTLFPDTTRPAPDEVGLELVDVTYNTPSGPAGIRRLGHGEHGLTIPAMPPRADDATTV